MVDAAIAYFDRLGASVDRAWSERNRDEEALPDVAESAILALPPRDSVDAASIARAVLSPSQSATRQLAPVGVFGQPGVTLYYGRGFVIDVYFWTNALAAIHNHPFCGLFYILEGYSLHSRYDFEVRETFGSRMALGTLRLRDLSLLHAGEHHLFSLVRRPLIHTLLHVPTPSVSLVIRTVRTLDYLRYFPPAVALAMSEPDDVIARQLALLEMLQRSRDARFETALHDYLSHADLETTFRALSATQSGGADRAAFLRALEIARRRHGERVDELERSLTRAGRMQRTNAVREKFVSEHDRFVASVLLSAERRDRVFDVMRARTPSADPRETLHDWVETCGLFAAPDDAASRVTAHAMIDGVDFAGVMSRLRAEFPSGDVDASEASVRAFVEQSMFAPLSVTGP